MATFGQEMKNLRSELQEHRVKAVEVNLRTVDPNQRRRQNATRFFNYYRKNWHTPSWGRKKIRDEELKRIEKERTAEKKVTFTQDYNKNRGPDHESEQWIRGQNFHRRSQNYNNDGFWRNYPTTYQSLSPRPNFAYGNDRPNNGRSYDQRANQSFNRSDGNASLNESFNNPNGNGWNNGKFSRSPSTQWETSQKIIHIANQEAINLTILPSAEFTIDPRRVLQLTNKSFLKKILSLHLMWFSSPQPMIPLMNYQIFAR